LRTEGETVTPADLRAARAGLGLSQAKLAAALGVSEHTVAVWERGEQPVRHPVMLRLALERLAQPR
jgi:DNA-binding transcriptional regulator YiaG